MDQQELKEPTPKWSEISEICCRNHAVPLLAHFEILFESFDIWMNIRVLGIDLF
jgi:hypothetical protein